MTPASFNNWFQAAAAARNSGKRLPTNQEWQVAALGTPDTAGADNGTTTCNTDYLVFPAGATPTGSRSSCVSDVGTFDMVGNLWEWVAEWGDVAGNCTTWPASFGGDVSCVGGAGGVGSSSIPGALMRGGDFNTFGLASYAGVFAVAASFDPSSSIYAFGFRCAR